MSQFKPGLIIHSSGPSTDVYTILQELRTITRMDLEEAAEMSRDFPMNFSFEDIIQFQMEEYKRENSDEVFTLEDAIVRAEEVCANLQVSSVECEVLMPEDLNAGANVRRIASWIQAAIDDGQGVVIGLEGPTGVGKTAQVRQAAAMCHIDLSPKAGEFMYWSVPTLAPEDAVGIPYPAGDNIHFQYLTLDTLRSCKVIFLDEFNRPSHPKVHNALMQLMAEKRINDQYFENLQAVICAWNPADDADYSGTEGFDKAIIERIDYFLEMKGNPDAQIIAEETGCDIEVAQTAVKYWGSLKPDQQKALNPRRLAKICRAWRRGHDLAYTVLRQGPHAMSIDLKMLVAELRKLNVLTLETLVRDAHEPDFLERFKADSREGAQMRARFMDLVYDMKRQNMNREFCKVRHLFDFVHREFVPSNGRSSGPGGTKGLYNFVTKAVRRIEGPDACKQFEQHLEQLHKASKEEIAPELAQGVESFFNNQQAVAV